VDQREGEELGGALVNVVGVNAVLYRILQRMEGKISSQYLGGTLVALGKELLAAFLGEEGDLTY
jgi:hypothetical protein